jgi:drug/metabolite transporter (DMT)-like permease
VTIYLNPPLTAIFTYLFFGIGITFYFFVGGSIMLTGILVATLSGKTVQPDEIIPGIGG